MQWCSKDEGSALQTHDKIIKQMSREEKEDVHAYFMKKWNDAFNPDIIDSQQLPFAKTLSPKEMEAYSARFINEAGKCTLCPGSINCTDMHMGSKTHTSRITTMKQLDKLCGKSVNRKIFQGFCSEEPFVSRREMCDYWGEDMSSFGICALSVIRKQGLMCKWSESKPAAIISGRLVQSATCVAIPYVSTDCKYKGVDGVPWEHMTDGDKPLEKINQDLAPSVCPEGKQWWPCTCIHFKQPDDEIMATISEGQREEYSNVLWSAQASDRVWMACVYQLCRSGPIESWLAPLSIPKAPVIPVRDDGVWAEGKEVAENAD